MECDSDYGDFACPRCGLCGPVDVLRTIAAAFADSNVLASYLSVCSAADAAAIVNLSMKGG